MHILHSKCQTKTFFKITIQKQTPSRWILDDSQCFSGQKRLLQSRSKSCLTSFTITCIQKVRTKAWKDINSINNLVILKKTNRLRKQNTSRRLLYATHTYISITTLILNAWFSFLVGVISYFLITTLIWNDNLLPRRAKRVTRPSTKDNGDYNLAK